MRARFVLPTRDTAAHAGDGDQVSASQRCPNNGSIPPIQPTLPPLPTRSHAAAGPRRIDHLPPSLGLPLVCVGAVAVVLPPVPSPEYLLIVSAGVLALWPRGFRACERWSERRFPKLHGEATRFLVRYFDDLERRYPGSVPADIFVTDKSC